MTKPNNAPAPEGAPEGDTGATRWVTLREAAAEAGVSVSALRKWYGKDEIPSRTEPGPTGQRRMVPLAAVLDRAGKRPQAAPRTGPVPDAVALVPASMFEELQAAYLTAQEHALEAEVRARVAEHQAELHRDELARLRVIEDELLSKRQRRRLAARLRDQDND